MMICDDSLSKKAFEDAESHEVWSAIVFKRTGGPPLRFKARKLFGHYDGSLAIELWMRKSSGFVSSISTPTSLVVGRHEILTGAMDWLEAIVVESEKMAFENFIILEDTGFELEAKNLRRFRILAGEALDAWDDFVDAKHCWSIVETVR